MLVTMFGLVSTTSGRGVSIKSKRRFPIALGQRTKWCTTVKLGLVINPSLHPRMVGLALLVLRVLVIVSGAASTLSGRRVNVLLLPSHARMTIQ